jgi:hypothetical protein
VAAFIGFHEVTGHGSGKVSPTLRDDPAKLLSPYYATMEEGRADLRLSMQSADVVYLDAAWLRVN